MELKWWEELLLFNRQRENQMELKVDLEIKDREALVTITRDLQQLLKPQLYILVAYLTIQLMNQFTISFLKSDKSSQLEW